RGRDRRRPDGGPARPGDGQRAARERAGELHGRAARLERGRAFRPRGALPRSHAARGPAMNAGVLATALATGLVGSLHCPLMCGPLAVAGCRRGERIATRSVVTYLAGRLASYAALGALCGAIGEHALCVMPMTTVQVVVMV